MARKGNLNRGEIQSILSKTKFIEQGTPGFFHGRVFKTTPPAPKATWKSKEPPRADHDTPDWLNATEYNDTPAVLQDKVARLAALMSISKKTVVYSGAGISTSAGVRQAAAGDGKQNSGADNGTNATPSTTHLALAALERNGLIHQWIQQNHDGLPQKAGYPQERIVEIHGSWYDPSNPVVCYDGALRQDMFRRMSEAAETADLVIVLGTSLSGLNSDKVAVKPAVRSLQGKALGTVIVNLQQTVHDGEASIRIFTETDRLMTELLQNLAISIQDNQPKQDIEHQALVPYDRSGNKTEGGQKLWLNLNKGQRIRLNPNHNCQGAKQPVFMHIGSKQPHNFKGRMRQPGPGEGTVVRYSGKQQGWEIQIEGVNMLLGGWWMEAAKRGGPDSIPVVNVNALEESCRAMSLQSNATISTTTSSLRSSGRGSIDSENSEASK